MSGSTLKSPNWTPASVGGNVILVTGASSGIGKATALILAEAGASLGLVDIQEPKEISDFINSTYGKERAIAVSCDVRNAQAITEATQKIVAALGPLNGAANLAGVIGKDREIGTTNGNLKDMDDDEWNRVMDINLNGLKNCLRAQVALMQYGGSIVNAASVAGQEGVPFNSPYGASKAGVISITKSVAKEVGKQGIRINAIAPGVVNTPLISKMAPDEKTKAAFGAKCALGRYADPEEISKLVFWLLSDHSTYCTGATFNIDGGW